MLQLDAFKAKLEKVLKSSVTNTKLYATTKQGDTKYISLSEDASDSLLNLFKNQISYLFLDDEITYKLKPIENYNESEAQVYYYFNGENVYEKLNVLYNLQTLASKSPLNFNETNLIDLETFYITISDGEDTITLYKKNYPISVLQRGTTIFFTKDKENIDELKKDVLKIDRNFQFLTINNYIIIANISMLENQLGYSDVITQKAQEAVSVIASLNFLEDIAKLEEMAKTTRIAKKINLTKDSIVLSIIRSDLEKIKSFIDSIEDLKKSLKFNGDGKLKVNTKTGVEKLLKLLDDAYLKSELTETLYDSLVKEKLNNDQTTK